MKGWVIPHGIRTLNTPHWRSDCPAWSGKIKWCLSFIPLTLPTSLGSTEVPHVPTHPHSHMHSFLQLKTIRIIVSRSVALLLVFPLWWSGPGSLGPLAGSGPLASIPRTGAAAAIAGFLAFFPLFWPISVPRWGAGFCWRLNKQNVQPFNITRQPILFLKTQKQAQLELEHWKQWLRLLVCTYWYGTGT